MQVDAIVEKSLIGANILNVEDVKLLKAALDLNDPKIDGDKILGLDEQISTLKTAKPYLFKQESKPNTTKGFVPGSADSKAAESSGYKPGTVGDIAWRLERGLPLDNND